LIQQLGRRPHRVLLTLDHPLPDAFSEFVDHSIAARKSNVNGPIAPGAGPNRLDFAVVPVALHVVGAVQLQLLGQVLIPCDLALGKLLAPAPAQLFIPSGPIGHYCGHPIRESDNYLVIGKSIKIAKVMWECGRIH